MTDLLLDPAPVAAGGLALSRLGWGMWRLRGGDPKLALDLAEAALDAGMTLFDTADIYGPDNGEPFGAAEALFGEALARAPGLRSRIVLATKGGIVIGVPYNSSAAYLVEACEASLRRLRTDVIDLYQIHRPDLLAHPAEVEEGGQVAGEPRVRRRVLVDLGRRQVVQVEDDVLPDHLRHVDRPARGDGRLDLGGDLLGLAEGVAHLHVRVGGLELVQQLA